VIGYDNAKYIMKCFSTITGRTKGLHHWPEKYVNNVQKLTERHQITWFKCSYPNVTIIRKSAD